MDLLEREQVEADMVNVVSLFNQMIPGEAPLDPLSELLQEGEPLDQTSEEIEMRATRKTVSEDQFPDQSLYVLEEQLEQLKTSLSRIKFYLGDLEDLIPR